MNIYAGVLHYSAISMCLYITYYINISRRYTFTQLFHLSYLITDDWFYMLVIILNSSIRAMDICNANQIETEMTNFNFKMYHFWKLTLKSYQEQLNGSFLPLTLLRIVPLIYSLKFQYSLITFIRVNGWIDGGYLSRYILYLKGLKWSINMDKWHLVRPRFTKKRKVKSRNGSWEVRQPVILNAKIRLIMQNHWIRRSFILPVPKTNHVSRYPGDFQLSATSSHVLSKPTTWIKPSTTSLGDRKRRWSLGSKITLTIVIRRIWTENRLMTKTSIPSANWYKGCKCKTEIADWTRTSRFPQKYFKSTETWNIHLMLSQARKKDVGSIFRELNSYISP